MSETDGEAKRGKIGEEIFEQIEEMMAAEPISRTEAFQRLSDQTGRRAGTVAANYYRVARLKGAPLQKRGRRGGQRSTKSTDDVGTALANAERALAELTKAVQRQEAELTELREQSQQFDEFRRWAKKNM